MEDSWLYSDLWITSPDGKRISANERIAINVSGMRFETYESTLARYPNTLLGSPSRRAKYFDSSRKEYFFNRNRRVFDAILFYYQSYGRISKPEHVTEKQFFSELSFFDIGKKENFLTFSERVDRVILAEPDELPRNKYQRYIWELFSIPDSSILARITTFIGIFALVVSIILTCIESLPSIVNPKNKTDHWNKRLVHVLNNVCYVWFTIEFVFRLGSCVNKKQFFKSPLNWIDLVAILPFYLQLIIESQTSMTPLSILKAVRIFRIARILKVSRYSRGMRALIYTLYASRHELGLLFFIIFIATVLSGALTYYAEINAENTSLKNIPEALWWSINTITTVGYGDTYPVTPFGKSLGGIFSVFGTVLIGLPIFCLVSNFLELWESIKDKSREDENGSPAVPVKHSSAAENETVANDCFVQDNDTEAKREKLQSFVKYGDTCAKEEMETFL